MILRYINIVRFCISCYFLMRLIWTQVVIYKTYDIILTKRPMFILNLHKLLQLINTSFTNILMHKYIWHFSYHISFTNVIYQQITIYLFYQSCLLNISFHSHYISTTNIIKTPNPLITTYLFNQQITHKFDLFNNY